MAEAEETLGVAPQILTDGGFQEEALASDGWSDIVRTVPTPMPGQENPDVSPDAIDRPVELADFRNME